ncbi:hypothetical protein [Sulfitobacter sp. AS59]|uniref:hypothetical protein n=1 Tax=Sulfitobacter sp. AS59 TaxID=3135784 RepID=UPI0031810E6B
MRRLVGGEAQRMVPAIFEQIEIAAMSEYGDQFSRLEKTVELNNMSMCLQIWGIHQLQGQNLDGQILENSARQNHLLGGISSQRRELN